ncbi:MAG: MMPL family transporter, partial [Gammaproteobacteria bacterium]|nr:MMPL family transporter [Gammaproteobacteria bacterium]
MSDRPALTIVLTLLIATLLGTGIFRLEVTTDLRVYFSADNPQLAALEELEEKYRRNDSVFFLVKAEKSVYEPACLQLIYDLTEAAWQLPYAFRASSLSNYQYSRGDEHTITTRAIIEDPAEISALAADIPAIVAAEPALRDALVAADGSVTGVVALLALPAGRDHAVNEAVSAAREQVAATDAGPCGEIQLAGSATNSVALGEAVRDDLSSLVVLTYLVITLGLLALLRNLWATGLIMMVITLTVVATMGLFGWLGYTLSPTAGFVPSIVLTIAVADCVHIVSNYLIEIHRGHNREDAIAESLRINLGPVFMTSITTAIGVLSLNFSDSPPYRDLGNMVACGVVIAFFLSLTLLPAAIRLAPVPRGTQLFFSGRPAAILADWIIAHRRALLLIGSMVLVTAAAFIPRNELTENWHEYFTEHYEIRRTIDLIDARLGGIHRIYYDLETGQPDGITDAAFVQQLDAFAGWLEQQPGVTHTAGLHTTLKLLNRALQGNRDDQYRLPATRAEIAQFLLLYELSLPQGESIDNLIDQDRSATRLTVAIGKRDSEQLLELDRRATAWLATNAPQLQARPGTGLDLIFAHITHRNIRGLLVGTAVALAAISLLMIVALQSVRLGLISLLPNLAPATLAYGLWGMTAGYIDLALSVVICMSLGIVVDDTVHFMSKYRRARRELALDPAGGVRYAFRVVGMALVITSVVLFAGFGLLLFSDFTPTRETGMLLAITIGLALLVDFLLLPPLLLLADRKGSGSAGAGSDRDYS